MLSLLLLLSQLLVHIHPFGFQPPPTNLTVTVTVEPDNRNRGLAVEVLSEDYDSTSQRELEGDSAAKTQRFTFRGLREGRYEVFATLIQLDGGKWTQKVEKAPEPLEIR